MSTGRKDLKFIRIHNCECGNKYAAQVQRLDSTANVSGEKVQLCPSCGKAPYMSSEPINYVNKRG